jgi:hypothetical protein
MWPAISSEGSDCFDALSRSYQYVVERPLHYAFYAVVAILIGILGWLVVSNLAAGTIAMTCWAADWGTDSSRWMAVGSEAGSRRMERLLSGEAETGVFGPAAVWLIRFWIGCVKLLAVGFFYSYFWTASTCIYLLLRRDADATEMDEVYLEEDEETAYGLPPIETDQAGAPVVAEEAASSQEDAEPSAEEEDQS